MLRAKCRICGENLDTKTAYKVIINGKNAYFCNEKEHQDDLVKREKVAADKDKVYRLICDIIGRKEILNSILWKEKATWNTVASDEVIGQYLEENKAYLTNAISKLDNVEYNRIRYLSAIIKNSLGDFKPKAKEVENPKPQVDETFYGSISTRNNKRRSLADLEDEF